MYACRKKAIFKTYGHELIFFFKKETLNYYIGKALKNDKELFSLVCKDSNL